MKIETIEEKYDDEESEIYDDIIILNDDYVQGSTLNLSNSCSIIRILIFILKNIIH